MHTAHGGASGHRHSPMSHVIWMAVIGAAILVVLLALGKPFGEAILLAVLLSCPLMMIVMPFMHSKKPHAARTSAERQVKS